jgi:hypothetical protein
MEYTNEIYQNINITHHIIVMNSKYLNNLIKRNRYGMINKILSDNINVWSTNDYFDVIVKLCGNFYQRYSMCVNSLIFIIKFLKKYEDIKYNKTVHIKDDRIMYYRHKILVNDYIYLMSYHTNSIGIFKCFPHVNIRKYIKKHKKIYCKYGQRSISSGIDIIKYMIKNMYINYDDIGCNFKSVYTYAPIMPHYVWYKIKIDIDGKLFVRYNVHHLHFKLVNMYADCNYTINAYDIYDKLCYGYIHDVDKHNYQHQLITIYKWRYLWNNLKYGTIEEIIDSINKHGINLSELSEMNKMYSEYKCYKNSVIANNLRQLYNRTITFS